MNRDKYHGFPQQIDQLATSGKVTPITGSDGVTYWKLEVSGTINNKSGVFEFIRDAEGKINHRLFIEK